jgi:hypothetical protein
MHAQNADMTIMSCLERVLCKFGTERCKDWNVDIEKQFASQELIFCLKGLKHDRSFTFSKEYMFVCFNYVNR